MTEPSTTDSKGAASKSAGRTTIAGTAVADSRVESGRGGAESEGLADVLQRIGLALASERDRNRLVENILLEAKSLCRADGGTLYLVEEGALQFAMIHTDSLGFKRGGTTGRAVGLEPIPLFDEEGSPRRVNVAASAYHESKAIHVADAYQCEEFDLSGARAFDARHGYRSVSLLAVPLLGGPGGDGQRDVVGVLQLINAQQPALGREGPMRIAPFGEEQIRTVGVLAAQAGIALENQALIEGQRLLLDSFIRIIAEAIDHKSPYTGNHCERVPVLAEMLVRSLCEAQHGAYASFQLNDEQWRELRVAAWLHDCGKVTTPVHVMDKATKLEGIYDRIALVELRWQVLEARAQAESYRRQLQEGQDQVSAEAQLAAELRQIEEDRQFLRHANIGAEFLADSDKQRIRTIGRRQLNGAAFLSEEEIQNLCISRGTLTREERLVINGHMVQTIRMLDQLPFPRELQQVPEYATTHHEKMDGTGYPRGVFAGDLSLPARAMAIADVFEALTASDRPYKSGKTLSEVFAIMGKMKACNHLDPDLLDHFVTSGTYSLYAARYLEAHQIDEVDEQLVLGVTPRPFELPPDSERRKRQGELLPEYR